MSPDQMFQVANPMALLGWLALALAPLMPRAAQIVAGAVVPGVLSLLYAALILSHWAGAPGGFASLADVMLLFTQPALVLAGWVHFLAFDLLVGAWIARTAAREGISHLIVLPILALTFLFGPAGFLAFTILRLSRRQWSLS